MNNSKKRVGLLITNQFDHYMAPSPSKALNGLDYSSMVLYMCTYYSYRDNINNFIYLYMGNNRGCCSLRGCAPTLITSMCALVLATAPLLLSAGGKKNSGPRTYPPYGIICTSKNYTANLPKLLNKDCTRRVSLKVA